MLGPLKNKGGHWKRRCNLKKPEKCVSSSQKDLKSTNVQAYLMARREIGVDEELNISLDLVNVAKNPALLVRVEGLIPPRV